MKPDFAIIGAQKAGSTALMQALGTHPQVYLPANETRYFRDPWFQVETPDVLEAAARTDKPGVRRRGVKNPNLLGDEMLAQRLLDTLGVIDLVSVLREPVDRAISAYFYYLQFGLLPLVPAEDGLRAILAGQWDDQQRAAEVLGYGLYNKHLRRYADLFPAERMVTVLDEDLRADFGRAAGQVLAHLGVDTSVTVRTPTRLSSNEGVYSQPRLRFLQRRTKYIVRGFPGHPGRYLLGPAGARAKVMNAAIVGIDRLVLARILDNPKPAISGSLRAELYEYYRDDIRGLGEFLGRDLSSWDERNTRYIAAHGS